MSVNNNVSSSVEANKIIYAYDDAVNLLAVNLLGNMAEANIEMICDMQYEYPTKEDIECVFTGLHDQAMDTVEDMFDELKTKLLARLQTMKYTAKVRTLHYTEAGKLDDITIDLKTE